MTRSQMAVLMLLKVKLLGQNLHLLYKVVPMRMLPVEYLPDDYDGPNAGTMKELIGMICTNRLFFDHHHRHQHHTVSVVSMSTASIAV